MTYQQDRQRYLASLKPHHRRVVNVDSTFFLPSKVTLVADEPERPLRRRLWQERLLRGLMRNLGPLQVLAQLGVHPGVFDDDLALVYKIVLGGIVPTMAMIRGSNVSKAAELGRRIHARTTFLGSEEIVRLGRVLVEGEPPPYIVPTAKPPEPEPVPATPAKPLSKAAQARALISGLVDRHGSIPVSTVQQLARAAGLLKPDELIGESVMFSRARAKLGIESIKVGGIGALGHWQWQRRSAPDPAVDLDPRLSRSGRSI
jgi:hypothetical protein